MKRFSYLATPYSKYPGGLDAAARDAAVAAAHFLKKGTVVFSPIAHTHPIAVHGEVDPYNHDIWLPMDEAFMSAAEGMIVVMMPGWHESKGIKHEVDWLLAHNKPIRYVTWPECEVVANIGTPAAS